MSLWGIAYLPAVARLTTDENRASAYSLIFSASILTSAIGGAVTGYLPRWLNHSQTTVAMFEVHRSILLSACVIAAIAIWPSSRLHFATSERVDEQNLTLLAGFRPTPFLLRCLPFMALWTASMGAFLPFANVYLAREHHMSMQSIALIFSVAQCLQLLLGLLTPCATPHLGHDARNSRDPADGYHLPGRAGAPSLRPRDGRALSLFHHGAMDVLARAL